MLVMKFGGTSIDGAENLRRAAGLVLESGDRAGRTVVVVSAMAGATDALAAAAAAAASGSGNAWRGLLGKLAERHLKAAAFPACPEERAAVLSFIDGVFRGIETLLAAAESRKEIPPALLDRVMGTGERLAARLLALALKERGAAAEPVDADEGLIVTDRRFGSALPDFTATGKGTRSRLRPLVEKGIVPVVTGYIGATSKGERTTLGRGSSDYTATLVGAALDAEEVWIFSDVDGILSADPKTAPEARLLERLSYKDAAELAACGAAVLHAAAVGPLEAGGIPLRLRNTFNPSCPGTLVCRKGAGSARTVSSGAAPADPLF